MEKDIQVPSTTASHDAQAAEIQSENELLPALEKRILLKTDLIVLPLIVLTSTLAFLDKVSAHFHGKHSSAIKF